MRPAAVSRRRNSASAIVQICVRACSSWSSSRDVFLLFTIQQWPIFLPQTMRRTQKEATKERTARFSSSPLRPLRLLRFASQQIVSAIDQPSIDYAPIGAQVVGLGRFLVNDMKDGVPTCNQVIRDQHAMATEVKHLSAHD